MKITDLLSENAITLNGQAKSKDEAISQLVDLMTSNGNIANKEEYKKVVLKREEEGSTGIGEGIAIPHGKTDAVSKPGLAAMVVPNGVEFNSLDGNPANLLFLIAAPNTKDNVHLDVLSRLSTLLMDTKFRKDLIDHGKSVRLYLCRRGHTAPAEKLLPQGVRARICPNLSKAQRYTVPYDGKRR